MKPTLEEDTYKTQRREDKDTKQHNLKKNIGYLNKEETWWRKKNEINIKKNENKSWGINYLG